MPKNKKATHYITVNGVPACAAEETKYLDPPSVCQHEDLFTTIRMAKRIRRQLPEDKVEIVEGKCPRPDELPPEWEHDPESYQADDYSKYD